MTALFSTASTHSSSQRPTNVDDSVSCSASNIPGMPPLAGLASATADVTPRLTLKDYLPFMKPATFGKKSAAPGEHHADQLAPGVGTGTMDPHAMMAMYGGVSGGIGQVPQIPMHAGSLPNSHAASPVHIPRQPSSQPGSPGHPAQNTQRSDPANCQASSAQVDTLSKGLTPGLPGAAPYSINNPSQVHLHTVTPSQAVAGIASSAPCVPASVPVCLPTTNISAQSVSPEQILSPTSPPGAPSTRRPMPPGLSYMASNMGTPPGGPSAVISPGQMQHPQGQSAIYCPRVPGPCPTPQQPVIYPGSIAQTSSVASIPVNHATGHQGAVQGHTVDPNQAPGQPLAPGSAQIPANQYSMQASRSGHPVGSQNQDNLNRPQAIPQSQVLTSGLGTFVNQYAQYTSQAYETPTNTVVTGDGYSAAMRSNPSAAYNTSTGTQSNQWRQMSGDQGSLGQSSVRQMCGTPGAIGQSSTGQFIQTGSTYSVSSSAVRSQQSQGMNLTQEGNRNMSAHVLIPPQQSAGQLGTSQSGQMAPSQQGQLPMGQLGQVSMLRSTGQPGQFSAGQPAQLSTGQPGQFTGQSGQFPTPHSGQISIGQPSQLLRQQPELPHAGQAGHVPAGEAGQLPRGQSGQLPTGQTGHLPTGQLGQLPAGQPGQLPAGQPSQLATGQQGHLPAGQPGQLPAGQPGQFSTGQPGQLPAGQASQLPAGQVSQLTGVQIGKLSTGHSGQPATPQLGQLHMGQLSQAAAGQPYQLPTGQPSQTVLGQPNHLASSQSYQQDVSQQTQHIPRQLLPQQPTSTQPSWGHVSASYTQPHSNNMYHPGTEGLQSTSCNASNHTGVRQGNSYPVPCTFTGSSSQNVAPKQYQVSKTTMTNHVTPTPGQYQYSGQSGSGDGMINSNLSRSTANNMQATNQQQVSSGQGNAYNYAYQTQQARPQFGIQSGYAQQVGQYPQFQPDYQPQQQLQTQQQQAQPMNQCQEPVMPNLPSPLQPMDMSIAGGSSQPGSLTISQPSAQQYPERASSLPPPDNRTANTQSSSQAKLGQVTSSSLDDLLSSSPERSRNGSPLRSKDVLKPKVITEQEIREQREEQIKNSLKQSLTHDPYIDQEVLNRFVVEVEKYEKFVETMTKETLSGPTPLDKEWKVKCLVLREVLP